MSETAKSREQLKGYCKGCGIDVGYGGDPIIPTAITIDLEKPYTCVGNAPQNLVAVGHLLPWFRDGVLDYVYSSHLLEDFVDPIPVLEEWLRVLKVGGNLIIVCPDEQRYRAHCKATGQGQNFLHQHDEFGIEWLVDRIYARFENISLRYSNPNVGEYSFELVLTKIGR